MNVCLFIYLFNSFLFKKDFIYLFLERGEGKEKERERNINVWLPLTRLLLWGPCLQPRHVPWLGIEPVTFWFPIHWATPARAFLCMHVCMYACMYVYLCVMNLFWKYLFIFREKREGGKEEEKHWLVASHMSPNCRLNLKPRGVPKPGIEIVTFCFEGWHPTNEATLWGPKSVLRHVFIITYQWCYR